MCTCLLNVVAHEWHHKSNRGTLDTCTTYGHISDVKHMHIWAHAEKIPAVVCSANSLCQLSN